jgi:putative membrane protein
MTFWIFIAVAAVGLVLSGISPFERGTWWLEVLPVIIAVPLLWLTRERFPLTPLAYVLISVHAAILMLGGHYTYGHFAQGFVPAIIAREILLRRSPLQRGRWLFFIVVSICLAISACYEFMEWWAALIGGGSAEAFLGTQGDVWDTQWDMFLATVGAITALLLLSRFHDQALRKL